MATGTAVALVATAGLLATMFLRPDDPGELPRPAVVIPAVTGAVVRITPTGTGDGTSASWDGAAGLADLPRILASATPGTQVWLRADEGPYQLTDVIPVSHGGDPGAPVVVRGVDGDGDPRDAELVGDRVAPYDPAGAPGKEAFRLLAGADHLVFQELAFTNVGNGAFRIGADITDLTIRQSRGTNVRRFIEDTASSGAATASVRGLTVTNVDVTGYSRGFARLRYDSSDILFDGVSGDSQGQDGDPFSMGIHLAGTVHDVDIRNTAMLNSVSTQGDYWNGDGFATERDVHDVRFQTTYAAGNTDGGYDLKSSGTTMADARATDNKRNFRLHGAVTIDGCRGTDPQLRGGTGTQAQIQAATGAVAVVRNCTFTDGSPRTIVFDVDGDAHLEVFDTSVEHSPDARLQAVEPGATLQTDGISGA